MTAIAERLEQAIGTLRERFLHGLPTRLDSIAGALRTPAIRDVERGFHSLAGTAATYGLFGIAAVASDGEHACERAGDQLDEVTAGRLRAMLEQLREVAESVRNGSGPVSC